MLYFFSSLIFLVFALIIAPFCMFPDKMEGYGGYLTGLAAIGAALKYISPYLLILFFKKRYSNELIWKAFLNMSCPDDDGRVLETGWIAGLINYFRRNEETLQKGNPWYDKLPYLSDDIYGQFGGKHLIGANEEKLFEEIKELLFECANIAAMNSTPDSPMFDDTKYKFLSEKFKALVKKADEMNKLLIDVPVPVKKIIEDNDFFKSFFKQ